MFIQSDNQILGAGPACLHRSFLKYTFPEAARQCLLDLGHVPPGPYAMLPKPHPLTYHCAPYSAQGCSRSCAPLPTHLSELLISCRFWHTSYGRAREN